MRSVFRICFFLLAGVILHPACTKNFDELNTDPTSYNASNFEPNYLLTSAQLTYTGSTDFSYETWRANLIYCSVMMQQFACSIDYWAGDKYLLNANYTDAYWDVAYPEQVKPISDLIQLTANKPERKNLHHIARIWRVLIMQRLTDLYGDIPYTTAGFGYYSRDYFPRYDAQSAIYADFIKELRDAAAKLDPAADKPSGDAIYKGDIEKWKRFANSLLLRVGMRLSKADPATAQSIVQEVKGKTMQSNDDNAFLVHDATQGRPTINRNSQVLLGSPEREYVKWSNTMIDFLKSTHDPRLAKIAVVQATYGPDGAKTGGNAQPSAQKGQPNGLDLSGVAGLDVSSDPFYTGMADYSSPSPYLLKRGGPTFILTYAETELLFADAAQRWNMASIGSAESHYRNGIKAAMTFMAPYDGAAVISESEAEAYLAAHPYNPAQGLNMINTQYWVHTATMLDFYESWSNWRRTGFPVLKPVHYPNNATGGTIPRRFPYPLAEANTNPHHYKAASNTVPGGDLLTGRVWWDKP